MVELFIVVSVSVNHVSKDSHPLGQGCPNHGQQAAWSATLIDAVHRTFFIFFKQFNILSMKFQCFLYLFDYAAHTIH